jgi:multidrug efflux pump subunit AcrB
LLEILRRCRDRRAAAEFSGPLAGSSAATVVVFVPLAFLSGVTGGFFGPLSLTVASSLIFSFLITWLAVPLAAERLVTGKEAQREEIPSLPHRRSWRSAPATGLAYGTTSAKVRFATDSALEGAGFEPSVPACERQAANS